MLGVLAAAGTVPDEEFCASAAGAAATSQISAESVIPIIVFMRPSQNSIIVYPGPSGQSNSGSRFVFVIAHILGRAELAPDTSVVEFSGKWSRIITRIRTNAGTNLRDLQSRGGSINVLRSRRPVRTSCSLLAMRCCAVTRASDTPRNSDPVPQAGRNPKSASAAGPDQPPRQFRRNRLPPPSFPTSLGSKAAGAPIGARASPSRSGWRPRPGMMLGDFPAHRERQGAGDRAFHPGAKIRRNQFLFPALHSGARAVGKIRRDASESRQPSTRRDLISKTP